MAAYPPGPSRLFVLPDLAGGQTPGDWAYLVHTPDGTNAGDASDKKTTLDDLCATITKNVADISLQFQDGDGVSTVSAAGHGKFKYSDSAAGGAGSFQVSEDGAAYQNLIKGPASAGNLTANLLPKATAADVVGNTALAELGATTSRTLNFNASNPGTALTSYGSIRVGVVDEGAFTTLGLLALAPSIRTVALGGTLASPGAVTAGFTVFSAGLGGQYSTTPGDLNNGVFIRAYATATWSAAQGGASLEISTNAEGVAPNNAVARVLINQLGCVHVAPTVTAGESVTGTATLFQVGGNAAVVDNLAVAFICDTTNGGSATVKNLVLQRKAAQSGALLQTQSATGVAQFSILPQSGTECHFIDWVGSTNTPAVSAAGSARLYVDNSGVLQISEGGAAYVPVVGGGGGMAIGGTVTSGTAGSVLFVATGPVLAQDNTNFFWDATDDSLGLGTNTVAARLHVVATAANNGLIVEDNAQTIQGVYTSDGSSLLLGGTSAHTLEILTNSSARLSLSSLGYATFGSAAASSGSPTVFTVTAPAHTGLSNAEATDINFNLARTVTLTGGGGAIAAWRAFRIQGPTIAAGSAQTITAAATVAISDAPAQGSNVTLTNSYALWVQAGASLLGGKLFTTASATLAAINVGSLAGDPSSLANGDLWYNSSSNELKARINGVSVALGAGGGGMAIGGTVTSGTAGSVLFVATGPVLAQDNTNFFWDATDDSLGLGTNTVAARLHVVATAANNGLIVEDNGQTIQGVYTSDGSSLLLGGTSAHTLEILTNSSARLSLSSLGYATFGSAAASSGSPTVFTVTAPAHTGLSNAEATDINFNLARTITLTGGGGAIAAWRAFRVQAPTIAAAAAQTITAAATVAISGAPAAGTNATITAPRALLVESGISQFGGQINTITTNFSIAGNGTNTGITFNSTQMFLYANNTEWIRIDNSNGIKLGVVNLIGWAGGVNPANNIEVGFAKVPNPVTNTVRVTNGSTGAGIMLIGSSSITASAQLHVASDSATRVSLCVDSATASTVDVAQFNLIADDTNTVANLITFAANSNGTAASGFGSSLTWTLESSTTNNQNATRLSVLWTDATHATRTAALTISTVTNAGSLTEVARFGGAAQLLVTCRATSNEGIQVNSNSGAVNAMWWSDGTDVFFGALTNHTVSLISNGTANIRFTNTTLGFLGKTPAAQQTGGAQTAGGTYGATEQDMLQKAYDCLRTFGLLS
jgi:hypothetical protein